jgi:hypothetical protein
MGASVRRWRDFREPDQSPWLADDAMRTFVNTYGSHLREEGPEPVSTLTCCIAPRISWRTIWRRSA